MVLIMIPLNDRGTKAQLGDWPKATQLTRDGADIWMHSHDSRACTLTYSFQDQPTALPSQIPLSSCLELKKKKNLSSNTISNLFFQRQFNYLLYMTHIKLIFSIFISELLFPFYRWQNEAHIKSCNFPTQIGSNRTNIWIYKLKLFSTFPSWLPTITCTYSLNNFLRLLWNKFACQKSTWIRDKGF